MGAVMTDVDNLNHSLCLNPPKVPVITMERSNLLCCLGGLHIEIIFLRVLGNLTDGSGWTGALVEAIVASP